MNVNFSNIVKIFTTCTCWDYLQVVERFSCVIVITL